VQYLLDDMYTIAFRRCFRFLKKISRST